jgi:hypothetical protein
MTIGGSQSLAHPEVSVSRKLDNCLTSATSTCNPLTVLFGVDWGSNSWPSGSSTGGAWTRLTLFAVAPSVAESWKHTDPQSLHVSPHVHPARTNKFTKKVSSRTLLQAILCDQKRQGDVWDQTLTKYQSQWNLVNSLASSQPSGRFTIIID